MFNFIYPIKEGILDIGFFGNELLAVVFSLIVLLVLAAYSRTHDGRDWIVPVFVIIPLLIIVVAIAAVAAGLF